MRRWVSRMGFCRAGDTICVVRLDRLGRSPKELPDTIDMGKALGWRFDHWRSARYVVSGRRAGVSRLRRHHAFRTAAHHRTHP